MGLMIMYRGVMFFLGFTTLWSSTTTTETTYQENEQAHGNKNNCRQSNDAGCRVATRSGTICFDITVCKEPQTLTIIYIGTTFIQVTIG